MSGQKEAIFVGLISRKLVLCDGLPNRFRLIVPSWAFWAAVVLFFFCFFAIVVVFWGLFFFQSSLSVCSATDADRRPVKPKPGGLL